MAITKRWATNGIKSPIPNDPQGDNLVNYDEGFTTLYRTPIKDGGKPIGLDTFNQLMYDITDEIIENKSTLNQVAQQITGLIDDTQTSLTATWSSQLIDNKISTAAANIIDDNQTTGTLTWSSLKISAEIAQGGGGDASIDDNTIAPDKVWSSFKTNQMVKGGKTISITNFQTKTASTDTEFVNSSANAQIVNLNVKVKTTKGTTQGSNKYLGDIVVYYNSTAQEVLRESIISKNITGAPNDEITSALGSVILDAQDTLLVKGVPNTLWTDAKIDGYTANLTTEAPEPQPLGEGLIFTAQASSSSVTFNKQGTPTELQLEYQTTIGDITSGWQDYTLGTRIDLNPDDKVSFRNKGTQTITQTDTNYHYFTMTGEIKAENDLTYLFDGAGAVDAIAEYGCYKMFSGCAALTQMPDLNATNIGANGYANMFEGCTKLKTIKPLNATTLANYSYKEMFKNCSGLIISETSGENQFLSMPAGAPSNAGENMFIGTGGRFTGTPTASNNYFYNAELPATDILRFTARSEKAKLVFEKKGTSVSSTLNLEINVNGTGWKSYTIGTIISLTNIGDYIEFRNIGVQHPTDLKSGTYGFCGPKNPAAHHYFTVSGNLMYLFDKTGEKKNMPAYGFSYLFSYGYANYANIFYFNNIQLPATTLAPYCYEGTFSDNWGGNDFTDDGFPALPATTLPEGCYRYMFNDCRGSVMREISATSFGSGSCVGMFEDCLGLKITEQTGYNFIFTAPSNASNACVNMFSGTGGNFKGTPTAGQSYYWNT